MFRKSLLLTACLCMLAAPMAFAAGDGYRSQTPAAGSSGAYLQPGMCYTGQDGRGDVINWAKSETQCRTQTNGGSWVGDSSIRNYDRSR